jgi:DNA-binding CsgD family transcriptional regulator
VATSITRDRIRERIVRLCHTSVPARQLRTAVLDQLRRAIGFESYVFVLTDPRTRVGCDPLADVPLLAELPRLIRLKYTTTVNRWTARAILAVEAGVDEHPATASVHLDHGVWITLRAARIGDSQPGRPSDIAVTIEHTLPADRLDIFSRAFALSTREAELLTVLATGADTRQAASTMSLSQHTVQDHLKSIFDKTAARSRRELLARALG